MAGPYPINPNGERYGMVIVLAKSPRPTVAVRLVVLLTEWNRIAIALIWAPSAVCCTACPE